jgi:hypothetical protein
MNKLRIATAVALAVTTTPLAAATAPVTLTFKNYRTLTNTVVRVVDAVAPGSGQGAAKGLTEELGIPELRGVNLDQPWQFAIWIEGAQGRPAMSVWIPTTDFTAFGAGLQEGKLLKGRGQTNTVKRVGDYASIWVPGSFPAEAAQAAHAGWKREQLGTIERAVALDLVPTDALRHLILQGLGSARTGIEAAVLTQPGQLPGVDGRALKELLGLYLDVFEIGFKGLERLHLTLDLRGDTLVVGKRVTALAGSDFAGWLRGVEGSLDSVLPYATGKAPVAFAMRLHASTNLMTLLRKFTRASLQVQGIASDSETAKETERLLDLMIPVKVGGIVDFTKTFSFAAVYEFPGRDLGGVHDAVKRYLQTSMQSQAGPDKPYTTVTYEEGKRELGGVRVDRATMVLNFDSPLYQGQGQREMLESMWPGGRMEFDYLRKGDRLFLASPDLMEGLLAQGPAASAPKPPSITRDTVAYGHVNLVKSLPRMLQANPAVPADVKERLGRLDSEGTEVTVQLDLNGTLIGQADIPLRLLSSLGKLRN